MFYMSVITIFLVADISGFLISHNYIVRRVNQDLNVIDISLFVRKPALRVNSNCKPEFLIMKKKRSYTIYIGSKTLAMIRLHRSAG